MTKFNLSEKILSELYGEYNHVIDDTEFNPEDSLKVKDVKEFIRLLKEEAKENLNPDESYWFVKFIDELAGERLI